MRAVVHHGDDSEQTVILVKGGELSIEVTGLDGDTLQFVTLDVDTTRELFDLLRDELPRWLGEAGVAIAKVGE